jgi:hypothetical protein
LGGDVVAKIGRNDPCPCGSGKKYKLCCLKKRQKNTSDTRQQEAAASYLFGRIMEMVQSSPAVDFASALDLYWDGKFSHQDVPDIEQEDMLRFIDWYAFDYRMSTGRARMIDLLGGQSLSEGQQALWERWREIPISLYRVETRAATGRVTLRDLLREDEPQSEDLMAGDDIQVGDLLATRVLPAGSGHVLLAPPIVMSSDSQEEIISLTRDRYDNYRQAHPEASMDEFLRENSHIFNHHSLRLSGWQAAPKLHLPGEKQPKVKVDSSGLITLAEEDQQETQPAGKVSSSGIILPSHYRESE